MKTILIKIWPMVVVFIVAMAGAWYLWAPDAIVPEVYKPAVKQSDGSLILEKKPDAKAKPVMKIPKGSVVERIVKITVQSKTPITTVSGTVEVKETITTKSVPKFKNISSCPPINVDIALIRNKDETRSVIVSSDDGEILGGVDIPVEAAKPIPKPKLWAAGAVINPFKETYGAFVDRDFGWLRTGVQINQRDQGDMPNQFWVKAGVRF